MHWRCKCVRDESHILLSWAACSVCSHSMHWPQNYFEAFVWQHVPWIVLDYSVSYSYNYRHSYLAAAHCQHPHLSHWAAPLEACIKQLLCFCWVTHSVDPPWFPSHGKGSESSSSCRDQNDSSLKSEEEYFGSCVVVGAALQSFLRLGHISKKHLMILLLLIFHIVMWRLVSGQVLINYV